MKFRATLYSTGNYVSLTIGNGRQGGAVIRFVPRRVSRKVCADDAMKLWGFKRIEPWLKTQNIGAGAFWETGVTQCATPLVKTPPRGC